MNKILSIAAVSSIMLFAACSKKETKNIVLQSSTELQVPIGTPSQSTFETVTEEIDFATNAKITEAGFATTDIVSTEVSAFVMEMKNPTERGFGFAHGVDVYMVADGLPDLKVAYKTDGSTTVNTSATMHYNTLYLWRDAADIKNYILKDKVKFKLVFQIRRNVLENVDFSIKPIMTIKAEKE